MTDPGGSRPTALVTGASRGIGRAVAIALAEEGYDVAVTARTRHEGDPSAADPDTGAPLPGSLDSTTEEIRARGARAVAIPMDLIDQPGLAPTVDTAIAELGRLDLLVNNAVYVGPGGQRRFLDSDPEELARRVFGNVTAPMLITQRAVARMIDQPRTNDGRAGLVIDISSAGGQHTPRRPVGEGGWALSYAVSKAGFHRIADMVALECGDAGIRAFNLNPGFVATERVLAVEELAFVADRGIAPEVAGQVVAWFAASGHEDFENGSYLQVPDLAHQLGLLP